MGTGIICLVGQDLSVSAADISAQLDLARKCITRCAMEIAMTLEGTLRFSDGTERRTRGTFSKLIKENAEVFRRYFIVALFPGSLNVDVADPPTLQTQLDSGIPAPSFVIPKSELINMPAYIGDGQAWQSILKSSRFPHPIDCWIFRRVGSRVPKGVIEIVAGPPALKLTYGLKHGDPVLIEVLATR